MLLKQTFKLYLVLVVVLFGISCFTALYSSPAESVLHLQGTLLSPGAVVRPSAMYARGTMTHTQDLERQVTAGARTQKLKWLVQTDVSMSKSSHRPLADDKQLHQQSSTVSHTASSHDKVTQMERTLPISDHLALPMPMATLSINKLLKTNWIQDLQNILSTIPRGGAPISIASSNYGYRDILLNWLISAQVKVNPPLTHIIVLSFDKPLYSLLQERGINTIYAPEEDYLSKEKLTSLTKHVTFTEVMVLRLTVMRLLNHWGYDVANYDTDAVIARNPEALYTMLNDSDIIGSYGYHPGEIRARWGGATICCGMFMVRSSSHMEKLWEAMSKVLPTSSNDQSRLNYAIDLLGPNWGGNKIHNILDREMIGTTRDGFKATILPGKHICRQKCSRKHRDMYYVWHKGGKGREGKKKYARQGGLWFLRDDWEEVSNKGRTSGIEWLRSIAAS